MAKWQRSRKALKRMLASGEYENPSEYSTQKADFVARVLRQAREGHS
jgi:hypothetical protein